MIIVSLMGGLGNQLFQLAYAQRLACIYREKVFLDLSWFSSKKIRRFTLSDYYELENCYLLKNEINLIQKAKIRISKFTYKILHRVFVYIFKKDYIGPKVFSYLSKKGLYFNFDRYYYELTLTDRKVKYIYGYFQSEKYFDSIDLFSMIKLKSRKLNHSQLFLLDNEKINLALSMRLGKDYFFSKELNVCNESYYRKALEFFYDKYKNVRLFVFSDNIDKAKGIISRVSINYDTVYVQNETDIIDLSLLSSCDHFIISNSSFSWWGSYLAKNKDKLIIGPSKWYNNSSMAPDIYYSGITKVEVI